MPHIKVVPLGAGQDVGRSCVLVSIGGRNIIFDCGMHMGYHDHRRFPDFTYVCPTLVPSTRGGGVPPQPSASTAPSGPSSTAGFVRAKTTGGSGAASAANTEQQDCPLDELIDCVIITHFHLDHCGALPYLTELCRYNGPVLMTVRGAAARLHALSERHQYPTKAICPILLEDFRKITVERNGETNFFTSMDIKNCMKKVTGMNLHETVHIDDDISVTAYYAGHVLGAAMFHVQVGTQSVVYSGDYNTTPDRHLGPARIDRLKPDLFITETTYATTIRDSKRTREHDFLRRVTKTVVAGGKVLIPVFALGRAQELCILLDEYWEQMGFTFPIYFAAGLTERANDYYKLFISWTNQKIKETFVRRNMFEFKHIRPFDRSLIDAPGPMVLFATPGMLHAGLSLEVFKRWAGDEKNTVIIPGYCVVGTVGNKLLAGKQKTRVIDIDKKTKLEVRCKIKSLSFSAHVDAKGIIQTIRQLEPRNVMLVHGERKKMGVLKKKIIEEFDVLCFDPPNGTVVTVPASHDVPVLLSRSLLKRSHAQIEDDSEESSLPKRLKIAEDVAIDGVVVMAKTGADRGQGVVVVSRQEAQQYLSLPRHALEMEEVLRDEQWTTSSMRDLAVKLISHLRSHGEESGLRQEEDGTISLRTMSVRVRKEGGLLLRWCAEDEPLAETVRAILREWAT